MRNSPLEGEQDRERKRRVGPSPRLAQVSLSIFNLRHLHTEISVLTSPSLFYRHAVNVCIVLV